MHRAGVAAAAAIVFLARAATLPIARAARNVSLDDTFSQWTYDPPVCAKACDGAQEDVPRGWWQLANLRDPALLGEFFGSTQTATNLVGASATLLFSGTHVYYYGSLSPFGGVMNITLDDKVSTITTKLDEPNAPTTRQALLWSAADLDPHLQHTLVVTMAGGNIVDVDRVDITLVDNTDAPNPTNPHPDDDGDDDDGQGSGGKAKTWLILAIVGGCIGSLLLMCLLMFLCVRRRQRAATASRMSDIPGPVMRLHSEEQMRPIDLAPSLISPLPPVPPHSSDPLRLEFPLTPPPVAQQQLHQQQEQQRSLPLPEPATATVTAPQRPLSDPIPEPVPHFVMVRTPSMKPKTVLVSTWEPDPLATPPSSPTESDIQFTPHRASSSF